MREKLFTLTRSQRDTLERRYKQTNERRIAERIQAILLLDAGHNRDQTARILHVNPKTITRWVKLFMRVDLDTYCTLQSGGNEAALSTSQQQQLASWLDQQVRSTKEAIGWVEDTFDVSYSESGMLKLLQRMEYRYKKPAQVPAKADTQAQTEWLESYTEKRGALKEQGGRLYFVDAAHLLHDAVASQGWIKRNQTVELKTNSGRNRLNVLGAYSPDDHTLVSIEGNRSRGCCVLSERHDLTG